MEESFRKKFQEGKELIKDEPKILEYLKQNLDLDPIAMTGDQALLYFADNFDLILQEQAKLKSTANFLILKMNGYKPQIYRSYLQTLIDSFESFEKENEQRFGGPKA